MQQPSRVMLVVEDDDSFRTVLVKAMRARGYDARGARDHETARGLARESSIDFAIVDLRLPDATGLDVVTELRAAHPEIRIVVLTGYGSIATAMEAIRLGARFYLSKPTDADRILQALGERAAGQRPVSAVETPSLARVEWEHIQRVLADCEGNISEAARRLHMHRRSLQRKIAKRPVSR